MGSSGTTRLTVEKFTLLAIDRLANKNPNGEKWHCIHTVYSGFNAAFRVYFPDLDPVEETQRLLKDKVIGLKPVKGGVVIWRDDSREAKKEAIPPDPTNPVNATLAKMGVKSS